MSLYTTLAAFCARLSLPINTCATAFSLIFLFAAMNGGGKKKNQSDALAVKVATEAREYDPAQCHAKSLKETALL